MLIGGVAQELPAADTLPGASAPAPVDSATYTYTDGLTTTITEDGVDTTIAYNADGTVKTVSYPHAGKTRTETYSYTDGVPTGMTATEA